jgi:hypothetical protein
MSYDLQYEVQEQHIHFVVRGEDSMQTSIEYWKEIAETCLKHNILRALVEEHLQNQIPIGEIPAVVASFKENQLYKIKIAFVDSETTHKIGNEFAQWMAANAGVISGVFRSQEEALEWLLDS